MLADLGHAVELVMGNIFRQPVATVIGEIEFFCRRIEIEPNRVAHAAGDRLHAAAVEIHAHDLRIGLRRQANITRRADIDVELVIGPERHELPAVRLVVREAVVDDDGLGRIGDIIFDIFELRDLGAFGDIERAVVEGEAVGPIQTGRNDEEFAFTALFDHGIHFVENSVADEDGALVAEP